MRHTRTILTTCLTLLTVSAAASGQVIRLKPQANAESHQDVRLGDIATVSDFSPNQSRKAEELANMVVVADIDKPVTLKAESVLMALMTQRGTGTLGPNLQISGSATCEISILPERSRVASPGGNGASLSANSPASNMPAPTPAPAAAAVSPSTPAPPPAPADAPEVNPLSAPGTLRNAIIDRLMQDSGAARSDLQIDFNTFSPALDAPTAAPRTWVVRPLTRSPLGSVQFDAQLVEGPKSLQRLTVATEVRRRQPVLIANDKIVRGQIVTAKSFRLDYAYFDRKLPTLFTSEKEIIGLEAQRDIDKESQLDQRDFKAILMAHKGDMITILYIASTLEIQLRGQAMADAKLHDRIEVRSEQGNATYTALMVKKNVGVVGTITEEQEKAIREAQ